MPKKGIFIDAGGNLIVQTAFAPGEPNGNDMENCAIFELKTR